MKIILINPPFDKYGGVRGHGGRQIPLNLCYLAAYVRRQDPDIEIRILDGEAQGLSHEETVQQVNGFAPDLIGITTNTCAFDAVIDLTRLLKLARPEAPIVLGGPHPSAVPEQSLHDCSADFLVLGEGEITFWLLVKEIMDGGEAWSDIDGLAFPDGNGGVIITKPRKLIQDLDTLPLPARDLVDNELYFAPPTKTVFPGPSTLLATSRGCPCRCGFCSAANVWTHRTRVRKPEHVVAEIEECVEKYNVRSFNFSDEFFTVSRKRVSQICDLIIERELEIGWVCSARAQGLDLETLKKMKQAGCHEISFGIESGNEEILKRMDKRINLAEIRETIAMAKRAGLKTHAGFIIGYVGETEQTIQDTIDFAKSLKMDIAAFWIASPLPGSRLYTEAKEQGLLRPDCKWADYSPLSNNDPPMNLPNLSAKRVRELHREALKSFYLRPQYILSRIAGIRHFHDVTNLFKGLNIFRKIR